MTTHSRRKFLQGTATTGIAAATLAAFPPSIRRALAIPARHDTGTVKDVKHVVLLMQENRSFDSYFGTFKGVRGFGDRFAVPTPNGKNVFHQTYTKTTPPSTFVPYHLDATKGNAKRAGSTPHAWSDSQAAWDHGRMFKWPDAKNQLSMGYYETAEVPFQRALADAFTLCDHYHCGMHTGTIANRLFYWSGTNGPNGVSPVDGSKVNIAALNNQFNGGNDIGASTQGWTWTTYADRLEKAGVKWKVYQSLIDNFGCNEMMGFRHWRAAVEQMPRSAPPGVRAGHRTSRSRSPPPGPSTTRSSTTRSARWPRASTTPCPTASWRPSATTSATAPCPRCRGSSRPRPTANIRALPPTRGAGYTAARAGSAHRQSRSVERDGTPRQLRRERRFLRPRTTARPSRRTTGTPTADLYTDRRRFHRRLGEHHFLAPAQRPAAGRSLTVQALRPGPARADVRAVALEPRRLDEFAGVRSHLRESRFLEKRFGVAEPNICVLATRRLRRSHHAFNFNDPDHEP